MRTPISDLRTAEPRAGLIASAVPFTTWPAEAVRRLAKAALVATYARGSVILARGEPVESLVLFVEGAAHAGATSRSGRRQTFALQEPGEIYGLIPLVDAGVMTNDIVAGEPSTVLLIPIAAVRAELARDATLWQAVARELARRSRGQIELITRKLLDSPRAQLAHHLLSLATQSGEVQDGAIVIRLRITQERLGEMLAVTRQTATALVREFAAGGLIEWRYGRALVKDLEGLRRIAEQGADG